MITEDYVSFETAKLLKEKGFESDDCHTAYDENGDFFWYGDYSKDRKCVVNAPTLQMAMKWLREEYNFFIFISTWRKLTNAVQYYCEIRNLDNPDFDTLASFTSSELCSYEKACEAAIKYCLENLI